MREPSGDILHNGTVAAAVNRQKESTRMREPSARKPGEEPFSSVHYFVYTQEHPTLFALANASALFPTHLLRSDDTATKSAAKTVARLAG